MALSMKQARLLGRKREEITDGRIEKEVDC